MDLTLTPSKMTNKDVAAYVEHMPDLRRKVWLENGVKRWTHKCVMAWLDELGITTRRKHRRELSVPLDEAKRRILQTPFRPPNPKKRKAAYGQRAYGKMWKLIEPGPHSLFPRGASFTATEMRAEVEATNYSIFADGSRFVNEYTGETAYWYHGKLWQEGPNPKPYY